MREEKIVIHPMEYLELLSFKSEKQVNNHAWLTFTGQIPFEKKQECIDYGRKQTWVQVLAISDTHEYPLFHGVIVSLRMKVENQTCIVEVDVQSGSSLMDEKIHTRSFQNPELNYQQLLKACGNGYKQYDFIMIDGKNKKINQFVMQYQETDWQFIKRMAARTNSVVVPEYKTGGTKFYFGLPNRHDQVIDNTCEYTVISDAQEYNQKRALGLSVEQEDMVSYVWENREIFELGQHKVLEGKERYIYKISTILRGNELYHTYYMRTRVGVCEPYQLNQRLAGISLFGNVLKVQHEQVQISINDDENASLSGVRWFSYATIYSSEDGTGWYCMPEQGDRIRLYFPSSSEGEAYAEAAYHESDATLRQDPVVKFWRNKDGKEVQMSPEHILITNNDGSYIEMNDNGIEIRSEGSVSLRAKKSLTITSSNDAIELNAIKKISLKQGDTEINLGGDLTMRGARIKL